MVGLLKFFVVFIVGIMVLGRCMDSTTSSSSRSQEAKAEANRVAAAQKQKADQEAAQRQRIAAMSRQELIEHFKEELLAFCILTNPRLNYIKVVVRGQGLYCVHDFFNQYSLSAGSFGPALSSFISSRSSDLQRAKITKVGVWGTGEYSSGAWFDVS